MRPFMSSKTRRFVILGTVVVAAAVLAQAGPRDGARRALSGARYASDGALRFPEGTEHWVTLGASIGGDYAEGSFDSQKPGTIGVVQLEPNAYRALRETGRYADGTMLLLTFYQAQSKSEPQLKGFVQGEVQSREIHVIDRKRYPEEGRAFFLFPGAASKVGARLPLGSRCVECHSEHGRFDATFAQFYPLIRHLAQTAEPRN
jgi:hypothetical protein